MAQKKQNKELVSSEAARGFLGPKTATKARSKVRTEFIPWLWIFAEGGKTIKMRLMKMEFKKQMYIHWIHKWVRPKKQEKVGPQSSIWCHILCYQPTVSKPFMSSQNTQEQRKHLTRIEMPKVKVSPTAAKSPSISRNWISNGLDRLVGYGLSARVMEDAGRVGPGYPGIEIIEIGIQKVTKVGPPHRTSCLTSW